MKGYLHLAQPLCLRAACVRAFLLVIILGSSAPAGGQGAPIAPTTPQSYSLGDVPLISAFGSNPTPFTPLSFWNFTEGWFEPWIPPPNGELHLQRGGWVNTDSAFFSRELDPTFTFNAGTSGSRDEYIGASSLFIPLNRRLQIGLSVPFVDSLQGTDGLPSETSFGDLVITPQLMLDETETRSVSALLAIRTPTGGLIGSTGAGADSTWYPCPHCRAGLFSHRFPERLDADRESDDRGLCGYGGPHYPDHRGAQRKAAGRSTQGGACDYKGS